MSHLFSAPGRISILVSAALLFTGATALAQVAPQPPNGQQIPAFCDGMAAQIQDINDAINKGIDAVKADIAADQGKPALLYANKALTLLTGAGGVQATMTELSQKFPNPKTYAEAYNVYSYMDKVTGLLQSARFQEMVSASNNASTAARNGFNVITDVIAKTEAFAAKSGRCYMSPYAGG